MMVDTPICHFHAEGGHADLVGREAAENLYRTWAESNQTAFYAENEPVVVANNFVASIATIHHQVCGRTLNWNRESFVLPGFLSSEVLREVLEESPCPAGENPMYLYKNRIEMIWSYDDHGRLAVEDVWEPDPASAEIVKLDPACVITTREAAKILRPHISPLPSFNEFVERRQLVTQ